MIKKAIELRSPFSLVTCLYLISMVLSAFLISSRDSFGKSMVRTPCSTPAAIFSPILVFFMSLTSSLIVQHITHIFNIFNFVRFIVSLENTCYTGTNERRDGYVRKTAIHIGESWSAFGCCHLGRRFSGREIRIGRI